MTCESRTDSYRGDRSRGGRCAACVGVHDLKGYNMPDSVDFTLEELKVMRTALKSVSAFWDNSRNAVATSAERKLELAILGMEAAHKSAARGSVMPGGVKS